MSQTMKTSPLKAERKERGWSQAEVAEALGVNLSTVRRWERGRAVPYPYYRKKLATLFGKTTEELGLLWDIEENDVEDVVEEDSSPTAQSATPDVLTHLSSLVDPTIPQILGSANSLQGRNSLLIDMKQRLFPLRRRLVSIRVRRLRSSDSQMASCLRSKRILHGCRASNCVRSRLPDNA